MHPLQPRFAQAITGLFSVLALVTQLWPILAIPLVLVLIALYAPGASPVNWVFRRIAPPPDQLEPVAPVRFSQWLAVAFLALAIAFHVAGFALVGWIAAAGVAVVALISAITGYCIGCEIYRMLLARRPDADDLRGPLGLSGSGPWLAVLTAPGCARCGPAIDRVKASAEGREVTVIDLARRPEAAAAPVKSIPAVLAIEADGRVAAARAGHLDDEAIAAVLGVVA